MIRRTGVRSAMLLIVMGILTPAAMGQFGGRGQPRPNFALIDDFDDVALDVVLLDRLIGLPRARQKINSEKAEMKRRLQIAAQRQKQEEACQRYLGVRIDQMRRVCGLSGQQVKKLEVAGKGAFDRAMDKWLKKHRPQRVRMVPAVHQVFDRPVRVIVPAKKAKKPSRVNPPKPRKARKARKAKLEVKVRPGRVIAKNKVAVQIIRGGLVLDKGGIVLGNNVVRLEPWQGAINPGNFDFALVLAEPVWTKTVERVLSEKQIKALKTDFVERTAFKRRAAVASIVAKIDAELFFSDEQRPQLSKVVDEVLSMKIVAAAAGAGQIILGRNLNALVNTPLSNLAQRIPDAKVKAIFTVAQMNRWQDIKRRPVNAFGDPIRGGGFGGGGGFF